MMTQDERANMMAAMATARGRKDMIEKVSGDLPGNWQTVQTPYDIAGEMIDLVPDATHYAVLFSMEFLEALVKERGVDPSRIAFFADTDIEMNMARHPLMYGVQAFRLVKEDILTPAGFNADALTATLTSGIRSITGDDEMKFNKLAVVQNPPYQQEDGGHGRSARPVYQNFIETIIDDVKPESLVSINPSRWMLGGKGLDSFRNRMMKDHHVKKLVHFPGEREVFPSVSIKGGVNYFVWDRNHQGACEFHDGTSATTRGLDEFDIIVTENFAITIIKKVVDGSTQFISQKCLSRKPFGLGTNQGDWQDDGVPCYTIGNKVRCCGADTFTDKSSIINKWKVATSKGRAEFGNLVPDKTGRYGVLSNFFLIEPGAICTETYLIVNHFDLQTEATNFLHYMATKFFRFLLRMRATTQNVSKDSFGFVPDLGDYSAPWTDDELYDRFGLSRQERAYIENTIKSRKVKSST